MVPRLLRVDAAAPSPEALEAALHALRAGTIVALPTETFYGLAVDPWQPGALLAVNRLKGKDARSPLLLLLADAAQAAPLMAGVPAAFAALAARWPGPLTLVVPASERVPEAVSGGRGSVGMRVPGLPLPRLLAARLGRPITGASANPTGAPPPTTASEVAAAFPEGPALVLDGGETRGGAPSTVVDLTVSPPALLWEGAVPWEDLLHRL
jgi:L-threonylcarbamoyladenylate synthase